MDNYKHIILILPWDEDEQKYSNVWINDLEEILVNEVYEYTFEEAGECTYADGVFTTLSGKIKIE